MPQDCGAVAHGTVGSGFSSNGTRDPQCYQLWSKSFSPSSWRVLSGDMCGVATGWSASATTKLWLRVCAPVPAGRAILCTCYVHWRLLRLDIPFLCYHKSEPLGRRFMEKYALFLSFQGPPSRHPANTSSAASTGLTPGPNPRLGLSSLAPSVQHYFQEGLAPSTRRSYDSARKKFSTFCDRFKVSDPFPVTEHLLCSFAAFMADSNLATQTVKSYLAAIRNTQLSLGLPDPGSSIRCQSSRECWQASAGPAWAVVSGQGCVCQ